MRSVHAEIKLLLVALVATIGVFVIAACGGDDGGPAFVPQALERGPGVSIVVPVDAPIVIGVSTALTGPVGPRGSEYRDAVVLAVKRWTEANGDTIGGHEILVHAEDDGCTESDITAGAAERLLSHEGLVAVVGPQCSAGAEAVIPVYDEAGVVTISGSATRTRLTALQSFDGFFFRTAFRNAFEGEIIGQFFADNLAVETAWVVDDDESYGVDLARSSQTALEERGVEVVARAIRQGQVDFGELAAEIVAAGPDFVGFAGFNPEAALFYLQLRDAGYSGLFGATDGAASERDFVGPVGAEAAEGVYFAGCAPPLAEEFATEFAALHGSAPSASFVAHYADAATVVLDAVAAVAEPQPDGSLLIDPARLRDRVRGTTLAAGLSGPVQFGDRGERVTAATDVDSRAAELGLAGCQVQAGRFVPVFPELTPSG